MRWVVLTLIVVLAAWSRHGTVTITGRVTGAIKIWKAEPKMRTLRGSMHTFASNYRQGIVTSTYFDQEAGEIVVTLCTP